jgi:hypothetical protein
MPTSGRPKALDESQHGNICELVASGSSIRQVARYYGCSPSSVREAERNAEFRQQLAMAKAEAHVLPRDMLRHHADNDWRAAVAWMKHIDQDQSGGPRVSIVRQREANQFVADLIDSVERIVSKPEERADLFELLAASMPAAMRRRWDGQTIRRNRKQVLADFDKRRSAQLDEQANSNNGPPPGQNSDDISRTKTNSGPPPGRNPVPADSQQIPNSQCPFDLPRRVGTKAPE